MSPISRPSRIYIAIIAVVVIAIGVVAAITLSGGSSTPTGITVASGDCQSSLVSFSPPGSPAVIPTGTYVGITITNKSGHSCKFSKVSQQVISGPHAKVTTVNGYGLVFAQGWNGTSGIGPVSTLRGTAGSVPLTLAVGIPPSTPTAEFTLGLAPASATKNCSPQTVHYIAFSLDKVHWQAVRFPANAHFKNGLVVCTGSVSNLNTSPISLIPPANAHPHTTTTTHHHTTTTVKG